MTFATKNNVYALDMNKKFITGGIFRNELIPYMKATVMIGQPAVIKLTDGSIMKTSTVKAYI